MKNISFYDTPPRLQDQDKNYSSIYNEVISTPVFNELKYEKNDNLIKTINSGIILGDCGKIIDLFC